MAHSPPSTLDGVSIAFLSTDLRNGSTGFCNGAKTRGDKCPPPDLLGGPCMHASVGLYIWRDGSLDEAPEAKNSKNQIAIPILFAAREALIGVSHM